MLGRRAKAWILVIVVVLLMVEGYFVYRYYVYDATASGPASTAGENRTYATSSANPANPSENTSTSGPGLDASFVHRAADGNSRGDYTYLNDPRTNGDPNAVVLAAPSRGGTNSGDTAYGHNIGVWFEPGKRKWAIFNQDLAAVPAGAAFEVVVPPASERFVHRAVLLNIVGNATYLDDPLTNGKPDAAVSVTQSWNPGGGNGVYNDHPVGVLYDEDVGQWFVYNEDGAGVPRGAAFNIAVSGDAGLAR